MPIPFEYRTASEDFDKFLRDVMAISGLTTRNQAYTMAQAVLCAFRSRLSVDEALQFANVLPVALRALFVSDWHIQSPKPWGMHADWMRDVRALRADHNLSTDTAISDVAAAIRLNVDEKAFSILLATFQEGATRFWQP